MTDRVTPQNLPSVDVSRETEQSLRLLEDLVRKWNPKINLISPVTVSDLWTRHIVDSIQVATLIPHDTDIMDIGSGAGFPGLVIAATRQKSAHTVTLVESDARKCAFLREAARQMKLPVTIRNMRAENCGDIADIVTARALAPLSKLLELAAPHIKDDGAMLFPKGARWREEIDIAREYWQFSLEVFTSEIDDSSVILRIRNARHV